MRKGIRIYISFCGIILLQLLRMDYFFFLRVVDGHMRENGKNTIFPKREVSSNLIIIYGDLVDERGKGY